MHIFENKTIKDMWDAYLTKLYHSDNQNRKMALRDKPHSTNMYKGEGVTSYLTRLTQIRDNMTTIGDVVPESEVVCIALNGFKKHWDVFIKCVVGHE